VSRKVVLLVFVAIALIALVAGFMMFGGANMGSP
jgi:hypothetical protein